MPYRLATPQWKKLDSLRAPILKARVGCVNGKLPLIYDDFYIELRVVKKYFIGHIDLVHGSIT